MTTSDFQSLIKQYEGSIKDIRERAHALHASVNQMYDRVHPYGLHLDMVAEGVSKYGGEVCAREEDVLPLFFGAYYHDSMEDARMTYNDVTKVAKQYMNDEQAFMAAEIVYALTNEKGRTRAERANEKYFQGIRETPYAPFVKLADRLANITYSCTHSNELNQHMKEVYRKELPFFMEAIDAHKEDIRFSLPKSMLSHLYTLI